MAELFTIEALLNLAVLVFLQAVLGFDNLLYIAIESKRAPEPDRAKARRFGILLALGLRVVLLIAMLLLLSSLSQPLFQIGCDVAHIHALEDPGDAQFDLAAAGVERAGCNGVLDGVFTFNALVFLLGGAFIMYTAMKEITHMLAIHHIEADVERKGQKSFKEVVIWIAGMNLVFSFDSILSAIAITDNPFVLVIAIVTSGVLMIVMADRVSEFLSRNRMYEVLGLFILLIVGVLLLSEGGHNAHLTLFGFEVEAMSKTTFYFSVAVMVLLDVVQGRYQKKLLAEKKAEIERRA